MTVAQLIKRLQKEDPKRIVILSSDPEGNSYSELCAGSIGTAGWGGEGVGLENLTPELKEQGYSEDDVMYNPKPALILSP